MSDLQGASEKKLTAALEEIEAVLNPSIAKIIGQEKDAVAQACLIVGHEMDIKFIVPRNLIEISDKGEKLAAICSASQIQCRKVNLEDDWWRKDHGHLLGFWGKKEKPVALLHGSRYQLVDKAHVKAVGKSLAEEISPDAYMFYAPFHPEVKTSSQIFKLVLATYFKRWKSAILMMVFAILYALFPPMAVKFLFSLAIPENDHTLIFYLALGLIFSAFGLALFLYLQGLFFLNAKGKAAHFMMGAFWTRLLQLPSRFFARYATGNLSSRLSGLHQIFQMVDVNWINSLFSGLFALLYLCVMFYFACPLALIVLAVSLVGLSISSLCGYLKIDVLRKGLEIGGEIEGSLLKFVVGIGKLRTARAETHAFSYWASLFAKYQMHRRKAQNLQDITKTANHFLPLLSIFLVYAVMLVGNPLEITLSDFLAFNIAFGSFCLAVYSCGDLILQMVDIFPLWSRAKILLEAEPEAKWKPALEKLKGHIHLKNVTFSYNPKLPPILDDISLTIQPGELIGLFGSGKSTLLRLLVGLEQPLSGAIFFDDRELWNLHLPSLRKQIGTYFQEMRVFSGSINFFLAAGKHYPMEQIQEALEFSNFAKELQSFPMKGATLTATLSGSQKERLLLSKAVLDHPSIILLDEPTASLDNESRNIVNRNIRNLKATRLYATNHVNNLRKTDRIYVLDQGKIIQTGTFEGLAKTPGFFAENLAWQTAK